MEIGGTVQRGFEPVRDAFAANFTERGELGAACCVYVAGAPVVDLWGGTTRPDGGEQYDPRTWVVEIPASRSVTPRIRWARAYRPTRAR
jgi:hypothetical protein